MTRVADARTISIGGITSTAAACSMKDTVLAVPFSTGTPSVIA
jgi:hypothetical protein